MIIRPLTGIRPNSASETGSCKFVTYVRHIGYDMYESQTRSCKFVAYEESQTRPLLQENAAKDYLNL